MTIKKRLTMDGYKTGGCGFKDAMFEDIKNIISGIPTYCYSARFDINE
jgi:hypothetical protein